MGGVDGRDPLEDLDALKNELELYMPGLSKRATMIIANKMDLEGAEENLERLREKLASEVVYIYPATAAIGELGEAVNGLREQVTAAKKAGFYIAK
jgi:GTP-binding protein